MTSMALRDSLWSRGGLGLRVGLSVAVPVVVLGLLVLGGVRAAESALAVLLAAALVLNVARTPARWLLVLVVFVPVQLVALALLLRFGCPQQVVRDLGFLKDGVVAGLLVRSVVSGGWRRRVDAPDVFALAYLTFATLYLLLPLAIPNAFLPQTFYVRLVAWRIDALFVVLFLVVRRLGVPSRSLQRMQTAMLALACVFAAFALWEFFGTSSFNHFLVHTVQLPRYRATVLHVYSPDPTNVITYGTLGGHTFVRVGSLFNDTHTLGFFMLIPLAVGLDRLARGALTPAPAVATLAAAVALLLSLTRASIFGGLLLVALALVNAIRRAAPGRVRFVIVVLVGAIAITPLVAQTHVAARLFSVTDTQENDNQLHISRSQQAWTAMWRDPWGRGLGTNLITGERYHTTGAFVSEDYYLQVGVELGVHEMLLLVTLLALVIVRSGRIAAARGRPSSGMAPAVFLAGAGLAAGGFFLHVWDAFEVSLPFFALAALAVNEERPQVAKDEGWR